jgi:hypothetical protein
MSSANGRDLMEMLFTVLFTYTEAVGDERGVFIVGYSPEAGARLPVVGEILEIRPPQGERIRGRVIAVSRNMSMPSPLVPRPLDRGVLFAPGDVPWRSYGCSEVWSSEDSPEQAAERDRPRG